MLKIKILIYSSCVFIVGVLVGYLVTKTCDRRIERSNYLARTSIDSKILMDQIESFKKGETGKLENQMESQLDAKTIIIGLFADDKKYSQQARAVLAMIMKHRVDFPYTSSNPTVKSKVDDALAKGQSL